MRECQRAILASACRRRQARPLVEEKKDAVSCNWPDWQGMRRRCHSSCPRDRHSRWGPLRPIRRAEEQPLTLTSLRMVTGTHSVVQQRLQTRHELAQARPTVSSIKLVSGTSCVIGLLCRARVFVWRTAPDAARRAWQDTPPAVKVSASRMGGSSCRAARRRSGREGVSRP